MGCEMTPDITPEGRIRRFPCGLSTQARPTLIVADKDEAKGEDGTDGNTEWSPTHAKESWNSRHVDNDN